MPKLLGDVLKISAGANVPNALPPGCAPDVAYIFNQTNRIILCKKGSPAFSSFLESFDRTSSTYFFTKLIKTNQAKCIHVHSKTTSELVRESDYASEVGHLLRRPFNVTNG